MDSPHLEEKLPALYTRTLITVKITVPSLINNFNPNYKSITTKSPSHSLADSNFIQWVWLATHGKVREALESPQGAQILVTASENHGKRTAMDYSPMNNSYKYTDAYMLPRQRVRSS